jgi:hypothetical protein
VIFGLYDGGRQVGFAGVEEDGHGGAFFVALAVEPAITCDLSTWLLECILSHPVLWGRVLKVPEGSGLRRLRLGNGSPVTAQVEALARSIDPKPIDLPKRGRRRYCA